MKQLATLITALVLSSTAYGTSYHQPNQHQNQSQTQHSNNHNKNHNNNANHNNNNADSTAIGIGKGGAGGSVGDTTANGGNATGGSVGDTSATGGSVGDTTALGGTSSSSSNSNANSSSETTLTDVGNATSDVSESGNSEVTVNQIQPIDIKLPYAPEGLHLTENLFAAATGIKTQIRGIDVVYVTSAMRDQIRSAMWQGTNLCMRQSHGLKRYQTRLRGQSRQYFSPEEIVYRAIPRIKRDVKRKYKGEHTVQSMIVELTTAPHVRNSGNGAGGGDMSNSGVTGMISGALGQSATFGFAQVVMYCFDKPLDIQYTDVPDDAPDQVATVVIPDLVVTPEPFSPIKCGDKSERSAELQRLLNAKMGTTLPGIRAYGPRTTEAVARFQQQSGLPVNGKLVDRHTWDALNG